MRCHPDDVQPKLRLVVRPPTPDPFDGCHNSPGGTTLASGLGAETGRDFNRLVGRLVEWMRQALLQLLRLHGELAGYLAQHIVYMLPQAVSTRSKPRLKPDTLTSPLPKHGKLSAIRAGLRNALAGIPVQPVTYDLYAVEADHV